MEFLVSSRLPSRWGEYTISAYGEEGDPFPHVVLHRGIEALGEKPVPTRVHSECMTGDVFASARCDCGAQLDQALAHFKEHGGILIYLRQEGRGIGLVEKLRLTTFRIKAWILSKRTRRWGTKPTVGIMELRWTF